MFSFNSLNTKMSILKLPPGTIVCSLFALTTQGSVFDVVHGTPTLYASLLKVGTVSPVEDFIAMIQQPDADRFDEGSSAVPGNSGHSRAPFDMTDECYVEFLSESRVCRNICRSCLES